MIEQIFQKELIFNKTYRSKNATFIGILKILVLNMGYIFAMAVII